MALVTTGKGIQFSGILYENFCTECAICSSFPKASLLSWWKTAEGWDVLKCREHLWAVTLGRSALCYGSSPLKTETLFLSLTSAQGLSEVYCPGKGARCQLPLTLVPGCPCGTGGNKDNQLLTSSLLWHTGSAFPPPAHRSKLWGL